MSFLEVVHVNPNAVTKKMDRWTQVEQSDLVMKTIFDKLDQLYQVIYKASPVKTGYMRSTLKVSGGDGYAQIAVTAYYAKFVEKGTRRNRAQPFFFPNVTSFSVDIILSVRNLYMVNI